MLNETYGLPWPCDLYIEGPDQYRGWFQSSLLVGVGLKGGSPYRQCATHGWTLDGEGRAMSKSVGNIIEPEKIVKQYGADVLRLWVASQEFTEDVRISETILARLSEAYRKLRNTFRYALGNLSDFDPEKDALPAGELLELDQWILLRAENLVKSVRRLVPGAGVPQGLPRGLRFRHLRSERPVLRRAQGPPLYGGSPVAGAPQRSDRPVPAHVRPGAPALAAPHFHHRRGVGAPAEARRRGPRASTSRCFPSPAN